MAFTEFQLKQIEKASFIYMSAFRPDPSVRNESDIEIKVIDQSVILYQITLNQQDNSKISKVGIAKVSYIQETNTWYVFGKSPNTVWETYQLVPTVRNIEDFFNVLIEDTNCYFFSNYSA